MAKSKKARIYYTRGKRGHKNEYAWFYGSEPKLQRDGQYRTLGFALIYKQQGPSYVVPCLLPGQRIIFEQIDKQSKGKG